MGDLATLVVCHERADLATGHRAVHHDQIAAAARPVGERVGPMLAKLLAAARGGDPELAQFRTTINGERPTGAGALVSHLAATGGLRTDLEPDHARDIVWTLISPEAYELLVHDRGWSPDKYEQWLAQALADALA